MGSWVGGGGVIGRPELEPSSSALGLEPLASVAGQVVASSAVLLLGAWALFGVDVAMTTVVRFGMLSKTIKHCRYNLC